MSKKSSVLLTFCFPSALLGIRALVPCVTREEVLVQLKKVQSKSHSECRKKERKIVAWVKLKPHQFLNTFQRTSPVTCFSGPRQLFLVALFLSFFPEICFRF